MANTLKTPMSVTLDPAYLGNEIEQRGAVPDITFYQKTD